MIKNFNDYLPIDRKSRKKLNEQDFINIVGGQENFELLKEHKLITEEFLTDGMGDFFSGLFTGGSGVGTILAKRTTIEIIAGFISPLVQKLGIKKGGLLWYTLVYGLQHAVGELGMGILDGSKKADFCRAFSVGASQSVLEWTTYKGYSNILELFGLNGDPNSMIARVLISSLRDKIIANAEMQNGIEKFICENKIVENSKGVKVTLWEYITDTQNIAQIIK
jgi:hypothetical protein